MNPVNRENYYVNGSVILIVTSHVASMWICYNTALKKLLNNLSFNEIYVNKEITVIVLFWCLQKALTY